MQGNQPSGPLSIGNRLPVHVVAQTIHDQILDTDYLYLQVISINNCNPLKRAGQSVIRCLNRYVQISAVPVPLPAFF